MIHFPLVVTLPFPVIQPDPQVPLQPKELPCRIRKEIEQYPGDGEQRQHPLGERIKEYVFLLLPEKDNISKDREKVLVCVSLRSRLRRTMLLLVSRVLSDYLQSLNQITDTGGPIWF